MKLYVDRSGSPGGDCEAGNPIGELQEFTQKRQLKPPVYEFITEQGPPHNREFICVVKLGKFVERGRFYVTKTPNWLTLLAGSLSV